MQYMVSLLNILASAEHFKLKFTFSKKQKTASPLPHASVIILTYICKAAKSSVLTSFFLHLHILKT